MRTNHTQPTQATDGSDWRPAPHPKPPESRERKLERTLRFISAYTPDRLTARIAADAVEGVYPDYIR